MRWRGLGRPDQSPWSREHSDGTGRWAVPGARRVITDEPGTPDLRDRSRALFEQWFVLEERTDSLAWSRLREEIIATHLPLAQHLARRFHDRGEPGDDLRQVATVGLIKAVDRFDPNRGVEFTTFATPTILGELKRHFRDTGWAIHVPRRLQELGMAMSAATSTLTQDLGRSPTVGELADHLGVRERDVLDAIESARAYTTASLDSTSTSLDDGGGSLADTVGAEDPSLDIVEYRASLRPLLATLPARERQIIVLRFFRGLTQSQIAAEVGLSQMHVSRLLARSLGQLRAGLVAGG
ncbi:MAG: RNA polymerase sigma factor SigF [Actinomycetes bacterium]